MEKSFFQKIFCKGEVNIYVSEVEEDDDDIDTFEKVSMSLSGGGTKSEVSFNSDLISDDDLQEGGVDLSKGGIDLTKGGVNASTGMTGTDEINTNRNIDVLKEPVVSGLIFEDVDEQDNQNFVVTSQSMDSEDEQGIDEEAQSLINMLKNEGLEKEKEREKLKRVDEQFKEKVVESEIDMPLL